MYPLLEGDLDTANRWLGAVVPWNSNGAALILDNERIYLFGEIPWLQHARIDDAGALVEVSGTALPAAGRDVTRAYPDVLVVASGGELQTRRIAPDGNVDEILAQLGIAGVSDTFQALATIPCANP